jgi:hypothetical protein
MPKWGAPPPRAGDAGSRLGVDQTWMEGTMLQPIAAPLTGPVCVATPAWDKAADQKHAAAPASGPLSWLAAVAVTALLTAGVVALLVAEYGLLWAMLVAPWLDCVPAVLPWAY